MNGYSLKKFFASPFSVKALPYLLLVFAALGFLDAAYLTIQHYQHAIPPCTVGGCETVLTSQFATVFGVPIALLGAGFYAAVLLATGLFLQTHKKQLVTILFLLCTAGFLVGLALIGIQAFILHSWCYYCLFSELIDFLLFDTSWWLYNSKNYPNF
ncbi:MAG TPA: vitamin K epoxide reductase family protein [Patescibacteria group bacterium]|nr:vitamin K epoxide reductase family protein [Patescibacteria group bacterium]